MLSPAPRPSATCGSANLSVPESGHGSTLQLPFSRLALDDYSQQPRCESGLEYRYHPPSAAAPQHGPRGKSPLPGEDSGSAFIQHHTTLFY